MKKMKEGDEPCGATNRLKQSEAGGKQRHPYRIITAWILSLLLLVVGSIIYLLFRPEEILIFRILDAIGVMPVVDYLRLQTAHILLPDFVIYSLPGGLWAASYLLGMYIITNGLRFYTKLIIATPLVITMIIVEFLQLANIRLGTFDFRDIICYSIPLLIFIFVTYERQ